MAQCPNGTFPYGTVPTGNGGMLDVQDTTFATFRATTLEDIVSSNTRGMPTSMGYINNDIIINIGDGDHLLCPSCTGEECSRIRDPRAGPKLVNVTLPTTARQIVNPNPVITLIDWSVSVTPPKDNSKPSRERRACFYF